MTIRKYMLIDVEYETPPPEFGNVDAASYQQGILNDIKQIPGVTVVDLIDQGDAEELLYSEEAWKR